jgi:two-component system chemotaxis sensor kinase CheA
MDDFEKELKVGFLEEASQLLTDAEQCFLVLESNPSDGPTLDQIFRLAHNLKGSSKAVGFEDIGVFTHRFESFLLQLKNGELSADSKIINLLLKCNDHIRFMVDALKANLDVRIDSTDLMTKLDAASTGRTEPITPMEIVPVLPQEIPHAVEETLPQFGFEGEAPPTAEELELLKLVSDSLTDLPNPGIETVQDEDFTIPDPVEFIPEQTVEFAPAMTPEPIVPTSPAASAEMPVEAPVIPMPLPNLPKTPRPQATSGASEESIRVSLFRLEKLINSVGELVILQTVLREQSMRANADLLRKTVHQMGKVTKEVQDISMSLRMVPLKQTFQKMQRIVRDTANLLDKRVNLSTQGEDTELDKTVLESISDPLVHLIRNACDHGIETPAERVAAGKPETGTVSLNAYHQSGRLVIEVKDNGGGINGQRLVKKAIEKGILEPGAELSDHDAIRLIFHPGFSTKTQVTEVSGRGVGMDVVKTNIEALQGEVEVETELGKGTTFKVILPLTLAIIDGMVIKNDGCRFVVPLAHVHETLRPRESDIQTTVGIGDVLHLRGENLPLYHLGKLLGRRPVGNSLNSDQIAMVVRYSNTPFAVLVDDILGQQQVVIKEVGREIQSLKWMSGSAILGDGKPAIILEMSELVKPANKGVA